MVPAFARATNDLESSEKNDPRKIMVVLQERS